MVQEQPKPEWSAVPRPGCINVEFRVLFSSEGIHIANLRFSEHATIDEHDAPIDIDVICISGAGFTSIGEETYAIEAGQTVRWPKNIDHRLWTENSRMETLMVERGKV